MIDLIKTQLNRIAISDKSLLTGIIKGIERETLRCNKDGSLAVSKHPPSLGKSLTHKYITTDYSEALLELITPTFNNTNKLINFLRKLHYFVDSNIEGNLTWPTSVPMKLPEDSLIPIAQYGSSNQAKMKYIYREGLAKRYGKKMQMIAGVHYNISFPSEFWQHLVDFWNIKTAEPENYGYFVTMRNFQKYSWLLVYLFGASPIMHKSFINTKNHDFKKLDNEFVYLENATSLRMSDYGYHASSQQSILISYNNLENYIGNLREAIKKTYEPYAKIGVMKNGVFQQLNDSLLQIENEFYNIIRPKRTCHYTEPQLSGLKKYGVEYIEVRCLDCNPFSAIGIDKKTILFLDVFLLFCALGDNSLLSPEEIQIYNDNFQRVLYQGRDPKLDLVLNNAKVNIRSWSLDIIEALYPIAEALDIQNNTQEYSFAVDEQKQKILYPELTASARILNNARQSDMKYNDYILDLAKKHQQEIKKLPLDKSMMLFFEKSVADSIIKYKNVKCAKQVNFSKYIKEYFKQYSQ